MTDHAKSNVFPFPHASPIGFRSPAQDAEPFDLALLTVEVREWQVRAAIGMIKIGKRLSIAKENLAHGEFGEWLESVNINHKTANKYMMAARQFANSSTVEHLSPSQVIEMCSLPEMVDRDEFAQSEHVVPSTGAKKRGYELTVREIREVRGSIARCRCCRGARYRCGRGAVDRGGVGNGGGRAC